MTRIVVQRVAVRWTKASRGHPGATARNAVPRAFVLPDDIAGGSQRAVVHAVSAEERNDFRPTREQDLWCDESTTHRVGCVQLGERDGELRVEFQYDSRYAGQPYRRGGRDGWDDVCALPPREWARVDWNGRFVCDETGEWWYQLVVLNIAFHPAPPADLFVATAPTTQYSRCGDLY